MEASIAIQIEEKEDALPGKRIRAVGMCFYKHKTDLVIGQRYLLRRNPHNPRDFSCIEVKEGRHVRATLNKNTSKLLAPYLDDNTIAEPSYSGYERSRRSCNTLTLTTGVFSFSPLTELSVISTKCSQSLNLAGTCVCRLDLITWLFGWKEMFQPRTTMTSSSGFGLAGLSEVFSVEVGMTGLASSIRVAGATHTSWCCSCLFGK
ncbi:hypothetical protein ACROYT_G014374 [Oculina patagonica]